MWATGLYLSADTLDGAGRTLAAAVKGIGNGLHSRAAPLLKLLLRDSLSAPACLKTQDAHHAVMGSQLSAEDRHAIIAAVTSVALEHLLQHLRRGKGQVLWECVLSETHSRLEVCLAAGMAA